MLKVSILVPVYGVEQYIEKCARSLFEQTYSGIEYVFVNDCTKDDSIGVLNSVLEKYPHRKQQVRIVNHEKNKGLGAARRTAILNAKGDYILHVDSDDYIAENAVEVLVKEAHGSKADIVDCAFAEVANGNVMSSKLPYHGKTEIYNGIILSRLGFVTNQIWGRLIKRSLYIENNIINENGIDLGEDYSILPKLLYKGKRSHIDDILYYYRIDNGASYMNSCLSVKNIESCIIAHYDIYDYFLKENLSLYTKYCLEFGMLNLILFCHKNRYELLKSKLYENIDIGFWDLKLYGKLLKYNRLLFFSLGLKVLLTKNFLRKIRKYE